MTQSEMIRVAVFEAKRIRKIMHEGQWWFSVIDIIEVLTANERPRKYWSDLKKKVTSEGYVEVSEKIGQLKMLVEYAKGTWNSFVFICGYGRIFVLDQY